MQADRDLPPRDISQEALTSKLNRHAPVLVITKHGGTLDRRTLIKNLHVDHLTFRRIVMTLHMCDSIIEESESGKNTLYTIKNAA